MRSILPKACMLALTATASPKSRTSIMKKLCMEKASVIVGNCDRHNIILNCVKAPRNGESAFLWLMESLKSEQERCPKTVIYCRSIKSCSILFKIFTDFLGDRAHHGSKSAKNRLFAMYHHSTSTKCKKVVVSEFPKSDTHLRVVICTSAFGMGINVPDISTVIHWGASRTIEGFMQEFGRGGGRNLNTAISVVYYHATDISKTSTDDQMRLYAKTDTCRRILLQNYFTPDVGNHSPITPKHMCCDNCQKSCNCLSCPYLHVALFSDLA